ncbi:MAG: NAD-dependent epimerase/dehydratase family protein [Chitinophaga sp.]|uniref:NAD-dependent epimerase/dehydratase family protein n=1 Tax=Chitinophaga sp. TaxID=1869181 RepID=UPI0025BBE466|nr:NAD-dependent epimerase/dehydratase family protein [Chitinophaga sp.]MBV8254715.1 NAD-dependent epimerase/dehydratase family protein [Chitinophaga sp.]
MILVTGGTGLLGSHLIRSLVEAGKPVRAIYRKEPAAQLEDIRHKIEWVQGDILDVVGLEEVMEGIKQVYHCAGMVSFAPGNNSLRKVNVEGTANVVNIALDAGVEKLVHVSSVAALGRAKDGEHISEESEWVPSKHNSQYAVSKFDGELEVWRGIAEGLPAAIVNPSIILGSGFWEDGSSAIFKNVYKEFPYYTRGVNGFVDVRDVAKAMIMLMDAPVSGQRFILSADNWSYKDLFTSMANALHRKPPVKEATPFMTGLVWRVERLKQMFGGKSPLITKETAHTAQLKVYYDNSKIQQFLPEFHFRSLETTIAETCQDYLRDHSSQQ